MILVSEDGGVSFAELGLPFTPVIIVWPHRNFVNIFIVGFRSQFIQSMYTPSRELFLF